MLMKTKGYVNYSEVLPEHEAIHERLDNWKRWLRASGTSWTAHPMWRHLKEKEVIEARQRGEFPIPVNSLDAHLVEKAVAALPEKHRFAIRWWYVFSGNPLKAAREIAVTKERLAEVVKEGRTMLKNRIEGYCNPASDVVTFVNR